MSDPEPIDGFYPYYDDAHSMWFVQANLVNPDNCTPNFQRRGPYANETAAQAAADALNISEYKDVRRTAYNRRGSTLENLVIAMMNWQADGRSDDYDTLQSIRDAVKAEFPSPTPTARPLWRKFRNWLQDGEETTEGAPAMSPSAFIVIRNSSPTNSTKFAVDMGFLYDAMRECDIEDLRTAIYLMSTNGVTFTVQQQSLINSAATAFNIPLIFE